MALTHKCCRRTSRTACSVANEHVWHERIQKIKTRIKKKRDFSMSQHPFQLERRRSQSFGGVGSCRSSLTNPENVKQFIKAHGVFAPTAPHIFLSPPFEDILPVWTDTDMEKNVLMWLSRDPRVHVRGLGFFALAFIGGLENLCFSGSSTTAWLNRQADEAEQTEGRDVLSNAIHRSERERDRVCYVPHDLIWVILNCWGRGRFEWLENWLIFNVFLNMLGFF